MNSAEFYRACDAIVDVVSKHPGGCKNEVALAAIRQKVDFLSKRFGHLGYLGEKLKEIEYHSAILFSARKHRQWDCEGVSGAQLQAGWVRRAAGSFADQLRQFERGGKEPPALESV